MTTGNQWLGTAAAAEVLGLQSRTLYRFIDEGRLPAYRFGRVIRIRRDDLDEFVRSCLIEPGSLGDANERTDDRHLVADTSTASIASVST